VLRDYTRGRVMLARRKGQIERGAIRCA